MTRIFQQLTILVFIFITEVCITIENGQAHAISLRSEGVSTPLGKPELNVTSRSCSERTVYTTAYGGSGGSPFNQIGSLSLSSRVRRISLRSGSRIDQIALTMADGSVYRKGGWGGSSRTMDISSNDAVEYVNVCYVRFWFSDRVSYLLFRTRRGRILSGGQQSGTCRRIFFTFSTPTPRKMIGIYGRAAAEVDKIGFIGRTLC